MDDIITYTILGASAFLVVVAVGLLTRYRQVSRQINESSDLGRDRWGALESRLKKQDERVLDVMTRLEVIQARVLSQPPAAKEDTTMTQRVDTQATITTAEPAEPDSSKPGEPEQTEPAENAGEVASQPVQEQASQFPSQVQETTSQPLSQIEEMLESRLSKQDERLAEIMSKLEVIRKVSEAAPQVTPPQRVIRASEPRPPNEKVDEKGLLKMLMVKPLTSREVRAAFGVSREHASRVLTDLFDRKLVVRNDAHKPFVYELTDEGRLQASAD